ncbi:MAG: EpsI family protein [Proteobacteria bacterium]|nr:EpsI family protein [Pseudomonadota bacterium]
MIDRRTLLVAAPCLAASAAAYGLTPRREQLLLGARRLADIVPHTFGDWTSRDTTDLVAPATEDSLLAKLYQETLARIYRQAASGVDVMLMLAWGKHQTNDLQLHRPEYCYPAFGYRIVDSNTKDMPLASGVNVPVRRLVAETQASHENVVYWTRLGEYFPTSRKAQQGARVATAMHGAIADGLLARFSVQNPDTAAGWSAASSFAADLVKAVARKDRAALIGTTRAQALAQMGV